MLSIIGLSVQSSDLLNIDIAFIICLLNDYGESYVIPAGDSVGNA